MKNVFKVVMVVMAIVMLGSLSEAADYPGADVALEYSSYELPATGTTRGKQIVRWGSESFVNDDGQTMYRCKYIWADQLKQDIVTTVIETKYPSEKDVSSIVSDLDK